MKKHMEKAVKKVEPKEAVLLMEASSASIGLYDVPPVVAHPWDQGAHVLSCVRVAFGNDGPAGFLSEGEYTIEVRSTDGTVQSRTRHQDGGASRRLE